MFLPPVTPSSQADGEECRLKRFSLDLSSSIESRMNTILRECGVTIKGSEGASSEQQANTRKSGGSDKRTRRKRNDYARGGGWQWTTAREREQDDMDFESSMHDMYEKLRQQQQDASSSSSRRRKPILHMKDFLSFMVAEQTMRTQQQRYNAWQSIQSVKGTLKREFGIAEISTSCGWASVHLNATLMVLLKTLRKYTRAQNEGGMFTPSGFLHGASIDIRYECERCESMNCLCV